MNKNEYLNSVLDSHKMKHVDALLNKFIAKRDEIKEAMELEYGVKMYAPTNSGSYAKHTAINIKFDIDLLTPFKRDAFSTLQEMFDSVYTFLTEKYKGKAEVRRQKVSIGIIFNADAVGDVVMIDVVPGRELQQDAYKTEKDVNLYVNTPYGTVATWLQTNISKQIEHIKGKNRERNVIRLLKVWKCINKPQGVKSFYLELITIKAFEQKEKAGIPSGLWEQLKFTMEYIRDNAETCALPDPGNTNNNVADTLTVTEKQELSRTMKNMLSNIERNDEYLKTYFPENSKFVTAPKTSVSPNRYG